MHRVIAAHIVKDTAVAEWAAVLSFIEKSPTTICPNIVFIRDIVAGSVRLPYHHERMHPRKVDN